MAGSLCAGSGTKLCSLQYDTGKGNGASRTFCTYLNTKPGFHCGLTTTAGSSPPLSWVVLPVPSVAWVCSCLLAWSPGIVLGPEQTSPSPSCLHPVFSVPSHAVVSGPFPGIGKNRISFGPCSGWDHWDHCRDLS